VPSGLGDEGIVGNWLFHYLRGGNHLHDFSPYGNHGEINGASWKDGRYGWSLDFDGTDDYVDCGNDPSLNQGKITVMAWINTPNPTKNYQMIAVKGSGSDNTGEYRLGFDSDTGASFFKIYIGGTAYSITGNVLDADTWYLITATYDGETMKLYENGDLVNSDTSPSGNLDDHGQILYIGRRKDGINFVGTINIVSVYSVAKSGSWINRRFQRTKSIFGL